MSPEERERKRRWMVELNRRREASAAKAAQPDLDALNAIYGARFRHGQQVTVMGNRYTIIGAKWGAWLRVKNKDGKKFVCRPYDAYPVINLSGTVAFDGKDGERAIIGKCQLWCFIPLRHMPNELMIKEACVSVAHLQSYLPCHAWGVMDPVRLPAAVPLSAIGMDPSAAVLAVPYPGAGVLAPCVKM